MNSEKYLDICAICKCELSQNTIYESVNLFNKALCIKHQRELLGIKFLSLDYKNFENICSECNCIITTNAKRVSINLFNKPLCYNHQKETVEKSIKKITLTNPFKCSICNTIIDNNTSNYSKEKFGNLLCREHQKQKIFIKINFRCLQCNCMINDSEKKYSLNNYGIPLCYNDQTWLDGISKTSTLHAIRLYFALRIRQIPAELEKFDGYKTIDIAIPQARINIEVDGKHHNYNSNQAITDLKRTYHSFKKGYYTIRIPNSLIDDDYKIEEAAEYLADMIIENLRQGSY